MCGMEGSLRSITVNKDYYEMEDELITKSMIAYRIFKFLVNNMDEYNSVLCTQSEIQNNFGVSRSTVSRAMKLLTKYDFIINHKFGSLNVYEVNKNIVWNGESIKNEN